MLLPTWWPSRLLLLLHGVYFRSHALHLCANAVHLASNGGT
jgi:hypothetical protein